MKCFFPENQGLKPPTLKSNLTKSDEI